jgi:ribosomal protein S18 acetylase RimI-like enzyme
MGEDSTITVRRARPEDAAALGRLGAMLVRQHYDFDSKRFIEPGPQTEAEYGRFLVSEIGRKRALVLVAEVAGVVAGYTYSGLEGRDWLALRGPAGVIYDLLVDPERRGENVGRTLLQGTLDQLHELGARQVVLSTATRNEAAQRLFASAGFRPTMIEMTWDTDRTAYR